MRLIINNVFYNEKDFILPFLHNLKRVRDIFDVMMLDGAWQQETKATVNSTDNSKELIEQWDKDNHTPFTLQYIPSDHLWRTESEKRNHLLKLTEEKHGECLVFVLDTDEFVRFPSGLQAIDLLRDLKHKEGCGMINVYGYGNGLKFSLPSIRFIPTGKGIHYHTEVAMILHDNDCNVLCNYNPGLSDIGKDVYFYDELFLINVWLLRDNQRLVNKNDYYVWQKNQDLNKKCQWKNQ